MKPFFTNPFKPLITRTGTAIGKAVERTMLQAVDGPGTIRKQFQTNPDGSTTMLHTQNGLARFMTTSSSCGITTTVAAQIEGFIRHTINGTFKAGQVLKVTFKDVTAISGVDYTPSPTAYPEWIVSYSDGNVSILSDCVTFNLDVPSDGTEGVHKTYKMRIGCAKSVGDTFYTA